MCAGSLDFHASSNCNRFLARNNDEGAEPMMTLSTTGHHAVDSDITLSTASRCRQRKPRLLPRLHFALALAVGSLLPGAQALVPGLIARAGHPMAPIPAWLPAACGATRPTRGSAPPLAPPAHAQGAKRRRGAVFMSASSSPADLVKQGAQIGVGAGAMFALERSLWALSKALDVWIPTAPAGMILVFVVLLAIHAVSPRMAGSIKDWFTPTLTFYSKGVPLFFSPPLVQLPLSLGVLPLLTIFKYVTLVATGTVLSVVATGLAANALVTAPSTESPSMNSTPVGTTTVSKSPVVPRTSPVLKVAVAGMLVFAGIGLSCTCRAYGRACLRG